MLNFIKGSEFHYQLSKYVFTLPIVLKTNNFFKLVLNIFIQNIQFNAQQSKRQLYYECIILNRTGAGKSTLLNAIAGRLPISGGSITLNNKILDKRLSRKMRFVLQHDLFFPTLTLMETITVYIIITLFYCETKNSKH